MAIRETAKAQVYLDGKQAEAAIDSLKAKSKELRKAMNDARKAGNFDEYRKLEKEVKQIDTATRSLSKSTFDYQTVLKNINGASYNELNKALRTVTSEMRRMKRTDAGYKEKEIQVKRLRSEIASLNNNTRATTSLWSKFSNGVNQNLTAVSAIIATVSGAAFGVHEFIKGLTGLDDSLANVMKTTGMARKEVRELYSEFNKLNTRTRKSVLLEYAEEAGRLGKQSKADVLEFVDVANKIGTALGDDLGNAPEAIREVGKLVNIFKVGEQFGVTFGEGMEKIGSAINEIAANSSANAGYQIDYLKRLSGTAKQAKITASEILGYSSVLDQNGQAAEMAATAQGKLMIDMFTKPAKYAEIAGLKLNEFTSLLKQDANEAFLSFLDGINGNEQGFLEMAKSLDELGVDGSRAVQVLTTLASNTANIRKEQALANKAMLEGTSLTNEYSIKNNNLAGSWEKIQKKMKSIFVNTGLIEKFEGTITALATSIENGSFDKYVRTFKNLTLATIAYITVQKTAYNWDKLTYALRKSRIVTLAFFNGKMNLLTKATEAQTKAQKANNVALKANLWAFVASAIVFTIQKLIQYNKEAIKADRTHKQYIESLVEEQGKANNLFNTYKKLNPESEEAKRIKDKLVKLYPDLMEKYITEKGLIEDIASAQKDVNDEILRTVALRSKESEIEELGAKTFKKKKKAYESLLDFSENASEKASLSSMLGDWENEMVNDNATPDEITDKIASFLDIQKMDNITTTSPTTGASFTKISDYNKIRGEVFELFNANKQFDNAKKEVDSFYSFLKDVTIKSEDSYNYNQKGTGNEPHGTAEKQTTPLDNQYQQKINIQKQRYADAQDTEKEHKLKLLDIELWYLKEKEKVANGLDKLKIQEQIIDKTQEKNILEDKESNNDTDDLLQKYETYLQGRLRIQKQYEKDRIALKKAGGIQEQQEILNTKEKEELYKYDFDFAEQQEGFEAWADSILKLGLEQLEIALSQVTNLLNTEELKASNDGSSQKKAAILQAKIKVLNAEIKAKKKALLTDDNNGKTAEEIAEKYNKAADVIYNVQITLGSLSEAFEDLAPSTAEALEAAENVASGTIAMIMSIKILAIAATEGIKGVEKASVILAVIGAALQVVRSLFSFLNKKHDKKFTKQIEELQVKVDSLQNSYKQLEKAINNSFGLAKQRQIEEMKENMKQQQILLEQQIKAEKEKKKPDKNAIASMKSEIDNLSEEISKTPSLADTLTNSDAVSAVKDFSSSLVDAIKSGKDPVKAMEEVANNMVRAVVTELTSDNIQEAVNNFREVLASSYADGILSDAEKETINRIKEELYDEAAKSTEMINNSGILADLNQVQSAKTGGFDTISQDVGLELNGRFTAFQSSNEVIKLETIKFGLVMVEMKGLVLNIYCLVEEIRDNTNYLPSIDARLEKLEKYFKEL